MENKLSYIHVILNRIKKTSQLNVGRSTSQDQSWFITDYTSAQSVSSLYSSLTNFEVVSVMHIWIQWSRHAAFGSARLGSTQHDSEILSRCLARVRCVQKLPNALCEKDGRSISSDSNMHHWVVVHISQTAASHASFFFEYTIESEPRESKKHIDVLTKRQKRARVSASCEGGGILHVRNLINIMKFSIGYS